MLYWHYMLCCCFSFQYVWKFKDRSLSKNRGLIITISESFLTNVVMYVCNFAVSIQVCHTILSFCCFTGRNVSIHYLECDRDQII